MYVYIIYNKQLYINIPANQYTSKPATMTQNAETTIPPYQL